MEPTPATPPDPLDADPELVVEAAYISQYRRLSRKVTALALGLLVGFGGVGYVAGAESVDRANAHNDTQAQIQQLVCLVIDQAPPDHGLADHLRGQYRCGPYNPAKALFIPKHPVPSTTPAH